MKFWWYKLTHWEFWPVWIIYMPSCLLWCGFVIKFRSYTFYRHANPAIKNGGLFGDSKFEIYKLLPSELFPITILVEVNAINNLERLIDENQLNFPLIVKPDIGCRGQGVAKVYNMIELLAYNDTSKNDYLLQELIDYPNEIGLFYYRRPTKVQGKVLGVTIKSFLTIVGNGKDTIEQLLKIEPRFALQFKKLRREVNLFEILPFGEKRRLVPFGNHNRGTQFFDGGIDITEELENIFDDILREIDGFYYGRLDIRYNTLEELKEGKNFSIIELNGAKSEPTHIYDAKYSFWYGQREIFQYQMLFMKVIEERMQQRKSGNKGNSRNCLSTSVAYL